MNLKENADAEKRVEVSQSPSSPNWMKEYTAHHVQTPLGKDVDPDEPLSEGRQPSWAVWRNEAEVEEKTIGYPPEAWCPAGGAPLGKAQREKPLKI